MIAAVTHDKRRYAQPVVDQDFTNVFGCTQDAIQFTIEFMYPGLREAGFFPGIAVKQFNPGIHIRHARRVDITAEDINLFARLNWPAFIVKIKQIAIFGLRHKCRIRGKIPRPFRRVQQHIDAIPRQRAGKFTIHKRQAVWTIERPFYAPV